MNTGENVPADLELALQSAAPIAVCGKHQFIFPSGASFLLHLIMIPHVQFESSCSSCRAILPTPALQHFAEFHDFELPVTTSIPDLYEISKLVLGKVGEDMNEYFNRVQLNTIDRHAYNTPLFSTVASLRFTMPQKNIKQCTEDSGKSYLTYIFPYFQYNLYFYFQI